jgi:hypothetical protein
MRANWREANAIELFPSDRIPTHWTARIAESWGMEGNVVAEQDDVWTLVAVSGDKHEAVVVNIAGGVVLIHATSDF